MEESKTLRRYHVDFASLKEWIAPDLLITELWEYALNKISNFLEIIEAFTNTEGNIVLLPKIVIVNEGTDMEVEVTILAYFKSLGGLNVGQASGTCLIKTYVLAYVDALNNATKDHFEENSN
ncbi:MAG: hypothetical protein WCW87_03910 [Candidatus Paceibacterota bacterium]